jgi:alkaline phosphatase D
VRCDEAGPIRVDLSSRNAPHTAEDHADAERDYTARVRVRVLEPATDYALQVRCGDGAPVTGRFTTAPEPSVPHPVRLVWGGDIGGQNVCRDAAHGYPIFASIAAAQPNFFIGLGDMVYADDTCRATGRYGNQQVEGPPPGTTVDDYRAHWKYNRADPALRQLMATVPYFPIWDDHEIRDDSGPQDDRPQGGGEERLLPVAMQAFLDFQPRRDRDGDAEVLYRSLRWGRHLEMFLLDTRQYRDRNDQPDTGLEPKTMLGATQRSWLLDRVRRSDATWKVIVSSVPLSIPTGRGPDARDGWADGGGHSGFEREAVQLLDGLRAAGANDTVFLTTDVHFATAFEYRPFVDAPDFRVHEIATGPLNAGVFPRRDLDTTFTPRRLFLWGPEGETIGSFDDALHWFNYGRIDIDADGRLTASVVNAHGETVWQTTLTK